MSEEFKYYNESDLSDMSDDEGVRSPKSRTEKAVDQLWTDIKEVIEVIDDKTKQVTDGVKRRLKRLRKGGQRALRKTITGNADKRVRDHARDQYEQTKERAVRKARKLVTGNANTKISEHLKTTPVVKLVDRICFFLGVANFAIIEFLVLRFPEYLWAWYLPQVISLIVVRWFSYSKKGWQFFMLDFCYFANLYCALTLLFFPNNSTLWKINFMHANGPLAMAMLLWRNSLVFHSVDKMSSVYIHLMPFLLTFTTRWYPSTPFNICDADRTECAPLTMNEVALSFVGYVVWQVIQIFLTEVVFASAHNRPEVETSIRWITRDKRNFMHILGKKIMRAVGIMGKDEEYDSETYKTKMIFWFMQFLYTIATVFPGYLVYHNYYLNTIWLFYVMAMIVWNGASFYIEVFAVRYSLQFTGKDGSDEIPDADTPPPRDTTPTKDKSGDKKNE